MREAVAHSYLHWGLSIALAPDLLSQPRVGAGVPDQVWSLSNPQGGPVVSQGAPGPAPTLAPW